MRLPYLDTQYAEQADKYLADYYSRGPHQDEIQNICYVLTLYAVLPDLLALDTRPDNDHRFAALIDHQCSNFLLGHLYRFHFRDSLKMIITQYGRFQEVSARSRASGV